MACVSHESIVLLRQAVRRTTVETRAGSQGLSDKLFQYLPGAPKAVGHGPVKVHRDDVVLILFWASVYVKSKAFP